MTRALIDFLVDFFHRMFAELKAARLNMAPSLDNVLASAAKEIDRLEQVAAARTAQADRLGRKADEAMDRAERLFSELHGRAGQMWHESERAQRIASRFRELLD